MVGGATLGSDEVMKVATLGSDEGRAGDGWTDAGGGVLGCGAGGGWTVGPTTLVGCLGTLDSCGTGTIGSGTNND